MNLVITILLALVASAFFSGIEIAYLSSNKFKIELESRQGLLTSRILSYFTTHPSKFICSILIGNNIALVIYGISMAALLEPVISSVLPASYRIEINILLIQTLVSTLLILIFGELIPKILFRINPNETLSFFALPVYVIYVLLFPAVWLVLFIAHLIFKYFFRLVVHERKPSFGRVDLDHYVSNIHPATKKTDPLHSEIQMFKAALDFGEITIRNCMVPRPDMAAININEPVEKLRQLFIKTGFSRIPVYRDTIDHIIGYVHSFEMFRKPKNIQSVLLPVSVFPETMSARDLLRHFTTDHRSIASVVDEHGITSGIVTVEDVMEEIFGEIQDEHDVVTPTEKVISGNEFILSGRHEVDYVNHKYGLSIPQGNYETISGFIYHYLEHIPQKGEILIIEPFLIQILSIRNNRIDQLRIKKQISPFDIE